MLFIEKLEHISQTRDDLFVIKIIPFLLLLLSQEKTIALYNLFSEEKIIFVQNSDKNDAIIDSVELKSESIFV